MAEIKNQEIHKIFIYVTYELNKEKFSDVLGEEQLPQNELIPFLFHIKNIGESKFSGGEIKEVKAVYEGGLTGGLTTTRMIDVKIPPLNPDQEILAFTWHYSPLSEGLVWLKCKISTKDKIEYYQRDDSHSIGSEEWYKVFSVTNREQLIIIKQLQKLNSQVKELLKIERDNK